MPAGGPEGFKIVMEMFFNAFPDLKIVIEEAAGEGPTVFTRGYWTGTQKGEFNGIPATGKNVKVAFLDCWKLENGKAVENWVQMDMVGMMHQMGVMSSPAASVI